MQKGFSIGITLHAVYDEKIVSTIVYAVQDKLGCDIYAYEWGELFEGKDRLEPDQAIQRIMKQDDNSPLLCRYEDTYFHVHCLQENKYALLALWDAYFPWIKQFDNSAQCIEIDLARYVKLVSVVAQPYDILSIRSETVND